MTAPEHDLFHWDLGEDGVVVVTMDDPTQSANTMNDRFVEQLPVVVDRLWAERDSLTGVVIASAKKTFFAGGDLELLVRAGADDAAAVYATSTRITAALRRLETLGRPVVAVLNGAALGGGYEIALACHHCIAAADAGVTVGLPEVTLGLMPGAGGTVRTVRMLGIATALQDVLLTGRRFRAADALAKGLVDELVDTTVDLVPAARRWIHAHPDAAQPWDLPGFRIPGGAPGSASLAQVLPALPALLRKQTHGSPDPAPRNLLAAAVEGAQVDVDSAQLIEARYFTELACGQISTNIVQTLFFDLQALDRGASRPTGYEERRATKAVVLGAGMMGAGIAYVCAKAGMDVVLKDVSVEAAERGKGYSTRILDRSVASGRLTAEQRDTTLARIHATADAADAAGADLLIEAVFEDPELKSRVIAEVLPHLAPDALLASNTSTLPITGLAGSLPDPSAFLGLHFFSPVDRMPLLEIVVGAATSDATLARAMDVARQIAKTPIVVNDSRGFFTSRVIGEFLNEALAMLGEGVPASSIEQAATQAGYPVGPLALLDELTLTLSRRIREQTHEALRTAGVDVPQHPAAVVVDRMIDEFGRTGRAGGAGFYDYADGRRVGLWPGLVDAFGGDLDVAFADLQERMLFAQAIDAVRCLDEGVLRSVADGNVGSILGIGYPAWTGGVLQYVDQYDGGAPGFVARARELESRYGARFAPPASLVARAEQGVTVR